MRSEIFFFIALFVVAIQAKVYCGSDYNKMRDKTCTFAQQNSACLDNANEPSVRRKCCEKGCSIVDIQKACCFTQQCLNRCYPGRNRNQRLGDVY